MEFEVQDGWLVVSLDGRIDSTAAPDVEAFIRDAILQTGVPRIRFDASGLSYISSAGLRVITRLLKTCESVVLVNASPGVYDVFEVTGIVDIMDVRRKPRSISLAGLPQIGAGAFGRVYRLDGERVAKVYDLDPATLDKIERERQVARQAFVHGIPSAIPFETVASEDGYGIVYELVDARTLGEAVTAEPERVEEYARAMANLLRLLHDTHFDEGEMPDARRIFHGWVDVTQKSGLYAPGTIVKLRDFVDGIPVRDTFVHGDFHPANIMVMPDVELLLIDMGDASVGDPLIDLAGTFHVLRIATRRPGGAERLCGMSQELLDRLWPTFLRTYYGLGEDADIDAVERRLRLCALPRTMGSTARSKLLTEEKRRQQAAELEQLLLAQETFQTE